MSAYLSKLRLLLFLIIGAIGLFSTYFTHPLNYIGHIYLFGGFLLLIFVGHKAAFRQHKHGILSQWTDPKTFVNMKLNEKEKYLVWLGLIMILSSLISFGYQMKSV